MNALKSVNEKQEVSRYTRYYEQNGQLKAYANRSMFLAILFGIVALASLGFAIYVRLQPPTVIRVDKDGTASVVGGRHKDTTTPLASTLSAGMEPADGGTAPTELEGRAVVRRFLEHYLEFTPDSAARNLAESLNMMTSNLRTYTMNRLHDDDTIGKIKDGQIISDFRIRSIERVPKTAWSFIVFGVKEVHHVRNGAEMTDKLVGKYTLRLVEQARTETHPSGLLVAEYFEELMTGDRETGLLQESGLERK